MIYAKYFLFGPKFFSLLDLSFLHWQISLCSTRFKYVRLIEGDVENFLFIPQDLNNNQFQLIRVSLSIRQYFRLGTWCLMLYNLLYNLQSVFVCNFLLKKSYLPCTGRGPSWFGWKIINILSQNIPSFFIVCVY